ncbi:citrate synthase/methylcitrate synthase [Planomicrobium sp. CPCC 101079]|uniref:citrate synthase/methylcitrate synthase n=1 Tax=Planomicrobium sp. CPCC 101079 TaxID=2599618 RepID=UPI0011B56232|nr:citrate synthase/methylcitrate synthase [Planomicrobium sp. CPCC 101079]TWT02545.1 citrate synthase/methylcitrate synthase [Planomicrobium sp. CPCC 101079]
MFQKGLKGVVAVQTHIASVDGEKGELRYRGKLVDEVINGKSFEETAYYLWHGSFPSSAELEELENQLIRHRLLPPHIIEIANLLPPGTSIMDSLRTLVSAYTHHAFKAVPPAEQAVAFTAALPVLTAMVYRLQNGEELVRPRNGLGHTANFLWMLKGIEPAPAQVEALETYLKLTMEHGMNASTFAARVTISTESDLPSAITSALGTMKGPLHGGAPSGVIDLLDEIEKPENISQVIVSKLEKGEKIMGFGHRVYRTEDPRSIILREKCLALQGKDPWLDLAVAAEAEIIRLLNTHKPGRALYTNVEFYAAAIMRSIDMPPELFTPTFSIARIVGWTAHALEQQQDNVIFRPQSEYIGN